MGTTIETPQPRDTASTAPFDSARAATLLKALSAKGEELATLLREGDADLVRAALKNPELREAHLLAVLRRMKLPEALLRSVAHTPQAMASRRVKIALAAHPATPPALLQELLGQLHLLELVEVQRHPAASADHKSAAQQAILKRLPDTELGIKITLARRGSSTVLEALLAEGELRLVQAVLSNPRLVEGNLLAHLRSPLASAETISAVLRHERWGVRPKIRLTALGNRNTPAIWFTLLLPSLPAAEVRRLAQAKGTGARQLEALREELTRREIVPMKPSDKAETT
ncbi:hypothetical protein GMLC_30300 [Geomonas limicola]|uniref:Uncharacterized protein n=1 Tax=Geomonas limicola TaxID=2740186 RepID=A0A6V8NAB9_9BACT|nr:hypothetical protein [Geomonas limicola]GFO69451.1 hypothetical protein GMLC_30300 [Geomonas limicola]